MSNQYIYRIVPSRADMLISGLTEDEQRSVGEHFQYLQKLSEEKICLIAGRTGNADSNTFGIMIFVANSEAEAREIMLQDPAIAQGVFIAELFPFSIATGCLASFL